jgi:hypothetical protein
MFFGPFFVTVYLIIIKADRHAIYQTITNRGMRVVSSRGGGGGGGRGSIAKFCASHASIAQTHQFYAMSAID